MGKIKDSLAVKTTAFVIIVIFSIVTALSTAIVIINAEYQWYSRAEEAVQDDIYDEVATHAQQMILDEIYTNYEGIESSIDAPLIKEENSAEGFGYKVKLLNDAFSFKFLNNGKESDTRIVNREFINSNDVVDSYEFMHGDMEITIYLGEINEETVPGELYTLFRILDFAYEYSKAAAAVTLLGIIVIAALVIFFFTSTGRKEEISKFVANVPIELCLVISAGAIILLAMLNINILEELKLDLIILMIIVDAASISTIVMGLLILLIIKIRHNNLYQSSICYKLFRSIIYIVKKSASGCSIICSILIKSLPLVWKSALFVLAGIFINLLILSMLSPGLGYNGGVWVIWFVGAVIIEGVSIYIALCMKKLKTAGECLAAGDLEYVVDDKGLFLDFKEHAENLNSISKGMSKAVEEKMKSERFKTELITNVSHDIKTPLTSIINYVDLISGEEISDEKVRGYVEVLQRQTQKLKKLTDDLVEASKAASGTVKVDIMPCKPSVLMAQAAGEYDSKMKEAELELVIGETDDNIEIMADGRCMWRIFDNLLNNICKYSQPGTRVYQSLEKTGDKAVITYKNTSRYQLNISEEELMERFVRGDSSRHTEGSGLGLSIARNLANLQGGKFDIHIDGDLFKVIVELPLRVKE